VAPHNWARQLAACDVPMTDDRVPVSERYWLLLSLRWPAVEAGTFKPIGQETPVPPSPQYPPGFLGAYISSTLFAPIRIRKDTPPASPSATNRSSSLFGLGRERARHDRAAG
jgi:hypothetical protein